MQALIFGSSPYLNATSLPDLSLMPIFPLLAARPTVFGEVFKNLAASLGERRSFSWYMRSLLVFYSY